MAYVSRLFSIFLFYERSGISDMDNHRLSPWSIDKKQVLENTETNKSGLSEDEVRIRQKDGLNELQARPTKTIFRMLKEQISDPMIMILLGASLFSTIFGEYVEAIIIALIVVLNTIISIAQEKKAQSSLEALRDMSAPMAHVIRQGCEKVIPAKEIVIGDIVNLHDGDMVPADLRLIESVDLKIQEASLTGESVPSEKDANVILKEDCSLGDRKNMAFSSTIVTYGRGQGVVIATGMNTEMGAIADMLEDQTEVETPLKRKQIGRAHV